MGHRPRSTRSTGIRQVGFSVFRKRRVGRKDGRRIPSRITIKGWTAVLPESTATRHVKTVGRWGAAAWYRYCVGSGMREQLRLGDKLL